MLDAPLSIFVPHSCCGCGNIGSLLCQICKNNIVSEPFSRCLVCLRPVLEGNLCSACGVHEGIEAAWCVGVREIPLKPLLDRYKFDSAIEAGVVCARLLEDCVPILPKNVAITAVPTSAARVRVRGFDHTAVIARHFAKMRSLKYRKLLDQTSSQTQHLKTRAERLKMTGIASAVRGPMPEVVLLVDDIYTTGATVRACAKVLRQNGVRTLLIATIARQTLDEASDLW